MLLSFHVFSIKNWHPTSLTIHKYMDSYEESITRYSSLEGYPFEHGTLPHNDPKKQNCPNWIKQVRQNFVTTSKIILIDRNWIQQQITMDYLLRSSTYTCQVGQSPPSPPSTIPTLITCRKKTSLDRKAHAAKLRIAMGYVGCFSIRIFFLTSEPNSPSLVVMLRVEEPQSHSSS